MRENVRGIRPSPAKIVEPNSGQKTSQLSQYLTISHREVVKISIGPMKAIDRQAASHILRLSKILRLANKIDITTVMIQRRVQVVIRRANRFFRTINTNYTQVKLE